MQTRKGMQNTLGKGLRGREVGSSRNLGETLNLELVVKEEGRDEKEN